MGREWSVHKYIDKIKTKAGKVRYVYNGTANYVNNMVKKSKVEQGVIDSLGIKPNANIVGAVNRRVGQVASIAKKKQVRGNANPLSVSNFIAKHLSDRI